MSIAKRPLLTLRSIMQAIQEVEGPDKFSILQSLSLGVRGIVPALSILEEQHNRKPLYPLSAKTRVIC